MEKRKKGTSLGSQRDKQPGLEAPAQRLKKVKDEVAENKKKEKEEVK